MGSKEPSHCDASFDYPHHMVWFRNEKFQLIVKPIYLEASNDMSGFPALLYIHGQTIASVFILDFATYDIL